MAETDTGQIRASLNPKKQAGDTRPAFEGHLSLPSAAAERPLALWAKRDRKGNSLLVGRARESAAEQIADLTAPPKGPDDTPQDLPLTDGRQFAIDPYEIMLFAVTDRGPKSPDYWGYYHPGPKAPLMRLAVWAKTDHTGKAVLSGTLTDHTRTRTPDPTPARKRSRNRTP